MATTTKSKQPSMIDTRFTEEDLTNIFTFELENQKKTSATCKIIKEVNGELAVCNFNTKGSDNCTVKKFNLWRHVKRNHPEFYDALIDQKDVQDKSRITAEKRRFASEELNIASPSPDKKPKMDQPKIDSYFKPSKVTITMDAVTFRQGIVEMVCSTKTPLDIFTHKNKGFRRIAGEMARELGVSIGYDAVCSLVIDTVEHARAELKETLKGKLCYLKMDAVTCGNRNFVAVNVQFYDEKKKKIIIKTLDIVDRGKRDCLYMKCILDEFGVGETQVLSVCVDDAVENVSNDGIISLEEESDPEVDAGGLSLVLPSWLLDDPKVQSLRCGVRSLRLAILDGLRKEEAKEFLGKIRRVVADLGTPKIGDVLVDLGGVNQPVDVADHRDSMFSMVDRLLVFRSFCEDASGELMLSEGEWDEVKMLKKLKNVSTSLGAADVTPGVFMKEWRKLSKFLSDNSGQIATGILSCVRKREKNLCRNTHFLAGVYVDPRYRILLSSSQVVRARDGLLDIARRLEKQKIFQCLVVESSLQQENGIIGVANSSEDDDLDDLEFEKELDRREERRRVFQMRSSEEKEFEGHFCRCCDAMESMGRFKVKSVFEAIDRYPEWIRAACRVASSVPTSQASVERLFSALRLILNDLGQAVKDDLNSAILFYRMNCDE